MWMGQVTTHLWLTGAFYVGNAWVAGGNGMIKKRLWIIPENSLRLAQVSWWNTHPASSSYLRVPGVDRLPRSILGVQVHFSEGAYFPEGGPPAITRAMVSWPPWVRFRLLPMV